MNITVYLGASYGNKDIYKEKVRELGSWIGKNKYTLVYGGSKAGLMGELAESCLDEGGKVIGVEPQFFIDAGFEYNRVSELIVTKDMSERKKKMIELGDAFIAFPGGTGTLEEISEIMSLTSLEMTTKPCILYNLNGYYDNLKAFINKMVEEEFTTKEKINKIQFVSSLEDIIKIIK